jgi:hypothetical protein
MPPEDGGGVARPPRPAPRAPAEIERDIGVEREALAEAVLSLRERIDAARAKVLSARTFAIAGSAVASLIALRARRHRKHRG